MMTSSHREERRSTGFVTGVPRTVLRIEGLLVLAGAGVAYARLHPSSWLFAVLILAPDLSMLGFLAGPRAGSIAYNVAHSYALPIACAVAGMLGRIPEATAVGLIWAAHIGLDRALGYGLKYADGFGVTHLGLTGRGPRRAHAID